MTPETVLQLSRQGLEMLLAVGSPLLIGMLVVGLVVSLFQALTQINEATLSFLPKLLVSCLTIVLAGPWMLTTMTDYLQRVLQSIPAIVTGQLGP
jgi:flagellar biosynthesis protein FliQ